jgi:hypothetical protein
MAGHSCFSCILIGWLWSGDSWSPKSGEMSFLNLARRLFALVLPDYWNNLTKYLEMRNLCKAMRRKQTHAQTNTT